MNNQSQHTIIIRCDGSHRIGLGHVVRCLTLAQKLTAKYTFKVYFAVRFDTLAIEMIAAKGYEIISPNTEIDFDYENWLLESLLLVNSKTLILDSRDGLTFENVQNIKRQGVYVASIDDIEDKRRACDAVFYPPIPQAKTFDWNSFTGNIYWGWEYVILRDQFIQKLVKLENKTLRLLVSMGGTDPKNLTGKIVKIIVESNLDYFVDVLIGNGYKQKDELLSLCKNNKTITIFQNYSNVAEIMGKADIAIISFGVTAYEIAALGVPAIYVCLFSEQMDSASTFVNGGFAINLGEYQNVSDRDILESLKEVIQKPEKWMIMREKLSHLAIKDGAKNIANIIFNKTINTL